MAEDEEESVEATEGKSDEGGESGDDKVSSSSSKKKFIIIIAFISVLIGGIGAGLYFGGMIPGMGTHGSDDEEKLVVEQITYFDMEEFLVNLNNPGRQVSFLKMTVTLELPDLPTKAVVEAKMPRIRDSFQVYLRELRNSDLQGSAGILRLRAELLLRINKTLEPLKVSDILFKEIIVQ